MACDVSVIVPTYNMEKFLPKGIDSLMRQQDVDMEVILVNDGSTDDSSAVCARLIAPDKRFRLIDTENRGSGPARNTGIEAATGEYLYFFDIDDSLEIDALCRMVSRARQARCDLLVFGYTVQHDPSQTPKVYPFADVTVDGDDARAHYDNHMEGDQCIQGAPWNKLFRRDLTMARGVRYPALRRNQDEVFIMRYMQYASSVRIVPDVLYHHLANTQERMWLKYRLDYGENNEKLFDFYDSIILPWNPDNRGVKKILYRLYYLNVLKAIRVLYNPKWKLPPREIYQGIRQRVAAFQRREPRYATDPPDALVAKSKLYPLLLKGRCLLLYFIMRRTTRRLVVSGK